MGQNTVEIYACCGHDGHAAILLGTAGILKKHEKELSKKVFLVFQPAEETAQGAKLGLDGRGF